jgi:hypothetical protein
MRVLERDYGHEHRTYPIEESEQPADTPLAQTVVRQFGHFEEATVRLLVFVGPASQGNALFSELAPLIRNLRTLVVSRMTSREDFTREARRVLSSLFGNPLPRPEIPVETVPLPDNPS